MRRLARTATVLAAAAALTVGLSGCGAISDLISGSGIGEDDVFTLAVGDCFDSNDKTGSGEEIDSVPTVECAKPHDYEVYLSVQMDDETYPGEQATMDEADEHCLGSFEGFFGAAYDDAVSYDYSYFYPTTDSWAMGDREILCLIVEIDENAEIVKVTDSLRDVGAA